MAELIKSDLEEVGFQVTLDAQDAGSYWGKVFGGESQWNMNQRSLWVPELAADWMRRIPSRRYGTPEDVADLALFLASDESRYINGEMIYVDGGATWAWSKPNDARYPRTYPFPA